LRTKTATDNDTLFLYRLDRILIVDRRSET